MESASALYRLRLNDAFLAELLTEFPAVMVTGARATGKTTTAEQHAASCVRLDQPGVAEAFAADPDAALRRLAKPLLIDEWQRVPSVLAAVKRAVDQDFTPGQFLLTGSVRAELGNETWAGTGRVVRMRMYGLTERELVGNLQRAPFLTRLADSGLDDLRLPSRPPVVDDYVRLALRGGFPELAYHERSDRWRRTWTTSYLDDLITRDALESGAAKDPTKLRDYVTVLALNNAGIPRDNTLYEAAGINIKTAAGYDQLLRNLYLLDLVPAWPGTMSRTKALTKSPKRYLLDTALAAAAAGVTAAEILSDGNLLGRFFDALALSQLRPELALMDPPPRAYHLRTQGGRHEVDLVIKLSHTRTVALEFKAGNRVTVADAKHLVSLREDLGSEFRAGAVLHSGDQMYEIGDRLYAVPLCAVWA